MSHFTEVQYMDTLPRCYTHLFARVSDAIEALEQQNFGTARDILIRAQQEAEELYIDEEEHEEQ